MMPFCDLRPCLTSLFSPRATPNGILLFSFAFPVCRVPFRPSQPERNFIFNTAYPPPARHFHPRKAPKRILLFFLCIPRLPRLFHPLKAPKGVLFLTLHSPSAAPFSPLKSPKGNFIFNTAYPPSARLFFSPRSPERNFIFSLYIHSPPPRPEAPALHYNIFGPVGRLSPRGAQGHPTCRIHPTIVPEMRCAAPKRRNFPARKRYGRHKSGCRDGHTR